ncbi:UPF0449 protein C19orf25-like [Cryptotermes secundus]|uniref:UPF0449 protein C19orf25-like n=1 Tax=Cryptotermes secundus TaxID=105785 RepID=UPI000CD7CF5F|nr:UPF0449 protein C19orf25-like [Cryptotermes secundus]
MFKKKHNIPPRPKPPVTEQILDDINNAPEDDVVFMVMTSTSDSSKNCSAAVSDTPSSQIVIENISNPEAVYQKVQSFLEVNSNLQTVMQKLQAQKKSLVTSDSELKKMAEDIRRQATDALK